MNELKIVRGNTFNTVIEVKAYRYDGTLIEDFDLQTCDSIQVKVHNGNKITTLNKFSVCENNKLDIRWTSDLTVGSYTLEVTGRFDGQSWRFYDTKSILSIVETNAEANIPQESIIKEDYYSVDGKALYIVCPKGETGPRGPKGDPGIDGKDGKDGRNGIDGRSFTYSDLTPAQIESLRGPLGIPGLPGQNGQDGAPGRDGVDGKDGRDGTDGLDGAPGKDGKDGTDGQDGHTPVITASKSGSVTTIYVDGTSIATIEDGLDGQDGQNGTNGTNGTDGLDGITPHIDSTNKHWMIGSTDTGIIAEGQNGSNGTNGTNGTDGVTPHIDSTTGNWFIGTTDTGVHAQGPAGSDATNTDESLKTTSVSTNVTYYPVLGNNTSTAENKYIDSFGIKYNYNSASGQNGNSTLTLGNATASPDSSSRYGRLALYGTGSHCSTITSGNPTSDRSITFPDASGTVALIWTGTQAQYDLLTPDDNTIYIITPAS